ncbi:MAG: EAL domain-containing protein [Pseudomonadota bacterium]
MLSRLGLTARYALMINGTMLAVIIVLGALFVIKLQSTSHDIREQSTAALHSSLTQQIDQYGQSITDVLAERMVNPLYALDMRALLIRLQETQDMQGVAYAFVVDNDNNVVHDGTSHIETYGRPLQVAILQLHADLELVGVHEVRTPIALAGEQLGAIHIGVSLQSAMAEGMAIDNQLATLMNSRIRDVVVEVIGYSLVMLILGLLLATVIARRFARPIRQLADYARDVGHGRRDAPPARERADEIGMLAQSLGAMSEDLRLSAGEAEYLAYHDSLTRLPNRAQLKRTLRESIARSKVDEQMLALLFIDLDEFKQVNDTLGHEAGDEFLTVVASRLTDCLSVWNDANDSGATLARLGGDEFTVVMRHVRDAAETEKLAAAILRTLSEPIEAKGHAFAIGASIGITLSPRDGDDLNVLLRNADRAMYRAKERGRNTYCQFDKSMDGTATRQLSLEADLRDVLNNHDLKLEYQPIVRAATGEVVAVEALCRWHHPVLGYVQPSRFVQLAEQSGQIEHLDQFVISQLTADLRDLNDAGFTRLEAAANIASLHHKDPMIIEHIAERLDHHNLHGSRLRIEVREKSIMRHLERAALATGKLADLGVAIWIDDFGTRIATLKHIDVLPISGIKIHSDFVDGISTGKNQRIVAQAITDMCHNLDLPVIAEGVEHQPQLEYLQAINCDYAQGYLFARPMPLEALISYMKRQQKGNDEGLVVLREHTGQVVP